MKYPDKHIQEFFLKTEFEKFKETKKYKKIIKDIEEYASKYYITYPYLVSDKKVFYHYTEWSGWRFYKKALLNLDFKSIVNHLKNVRTQRTNKTNTDTTERDSQTKKVS